MQQAFKIEGADEHDRIREQSALTSLLEARAKQSRVRRLSDQNKQVALGDGPVHGSRAEEADILIKAD